MPAAPSTRTTALAALLQDPIQRDAQFGDRDVPAADDVTTGSALLGEVGHLAEGVATRGRLRCHGAIEFVPLHWISRRLRRHERRDEDSRRGHASSDQESEVVARNERVVEWCARTLSDV